MESVAFCDLVPEVTQCLPPTISFKGVANASPDLWRKGIRPLFLVEAGAKDFTALFIITLLYG